MELRLPPSIGWTLVLMCGFVTALSGPTAHANPIQAVPAVQQPVVGAFGLVLLAEYSAATDSALLLELDATPTVPLRFVSATLQAADSPDSPVVRVPLAISSELSDSPTTRLSFDVPRVLHSQDALLTVEARDRAGGLWVATIELEQSLIASLPDLTQPLPEDPPPGLPTGLSKTALLILDALTEVAP
jgi:hypothetical protein